MLRGPAVMQSRALTVGVRVGIRTSARAYLARRRP